MVWLVNRHKSEDNIKMDLREIRREGDWMGNP
jgi:hypothetical protein